MKPYWQADGVTLYNSSAVEALDSMAAGSVQTVVTSPPYW